MIIVYDNQFNQNEWFVILVLLLGILAVWMTPKRFPPKNFIIYLLFSTFVGMVFDHTISIEPFDFYDVNDNSGYQVMDFLTYVMYGPFGYFYVYIYDYFKIHVKYRTLYIIGWALAAVGWEIFAHKMGVFHYKNGYGIPYSFPIYLGVLSVHLYFFETIQKITDTSE